MSNGSVLEKFIEEIANKVPTDDKIILNTSNIEIRTKKCIPNKYVKKEIILSWVEPETERTTKLDEARKRLEKAVVCERCHISGKECKEDCPTQYEAGTVGEVVEALETVLDYCSAELKGE